MNEIKEENNIKEEKYIGLVLSGGSTRGILHLGALCYAHIFPKFNHLIHLKYYVGTSIGAIVCVLLIIGYTPQEILAYILEIDFNKLLSPNIPNIFKYGYCSFDGIADLLATMIERKWGYIPTLKEIYDQTQKELTIVTYNYTDQKIVYLNHVTEPNINVIEGLKLSCAVPYLFHKVYYKKKRYIDGGFADNCAIDYLNTELSKKESIDKEKILALEIKTTSPNEIKEEHIINDIYNYFSIFMNRISELQLSICNKVEKDKNPKVKHYTLYSDLSMTDFKLNKNKKLEIFRIGFASLLNEINNHPLPSPPTQQQVDLSTNLPNSVSDSIENNLAHAT